MLNLYVIAGCNGAGKTTASFTVLPEMLDCDEFINADEIARGLSPLNPDKAAIEAGRIMLNKIDKLILHREDFAFETTLATKSYVKTIIDAKAGGYNVTMVFFLLDSPELAIERVKTRVIEGGHNIPEHVIRRRYDAGIRNLFKLYIPVCDYWMIFDNSRLPSELIAEGYTNIEMDVKNISTFESLKRMSQK
ncbi:MAG: zeta toxin family protein [Bacteroidales bacterium]|jgi:predicted ABC-type ATPase|nr:zeta toxin family protein [Bacteroidales bacterium]